MKKYQLIHANDVFDDGNKRLIYGINWLDDKGNIVDCEWFNNDIERLTSVINVLSEERGA